MLVPESGAPKWNPLSPFIPMEHSIKHVIVQAQFSSKQFGELFSGRLLTVLLLFCAIVLFKLLKS